MKFRSQLNIAASPDVKLRLRLRPVAFDFAGEGAADISTGPIDVEFGEIPVSLRIPFHRRHVLAANVGPFRMRVRPITVSLRALGLSAAGTIGSDDAGVDANIVGACGAEVGIAGDLRGKRVEPDAEDAAEP